MHKNDDHHISVAAIISHEIRATFKLLAPELAKHITNEVMKAYQFKIRPTDPLLDAKAQFTSNIGSNTGRPQIPNDGTSGSITAYKHWFIMMRKELNVTQSELAKHMRISQSKISLYEQGERMIDECDINKLVQIFSRRSTQG
jgi:ribosome-binding protein aMBF1 (putative translation factor)